MNRFNGLMDDMKDALIMTGQNKTIFLPALIINIAMFILIIAAVFIIIAAGVSIGVVAASGDFTGEVGAVMAIVLLILLMVLLFALLFIAVDVGINSLVIDLSVGIKPSPKGFFSGIKNNLFPVFFTSIGLNILLAIAFLILIIPILIYFVVAGLLTGGWAIVLYSCTFQALLGYWTLIKMEDHRGGFSSIGTNIRFSREHYWLMVLMCYLQISFAAYFPALLGFIGAAFASMFISYCMVIYFKMVFLLTYRRYTAVASEVHSDF